MRHRVDVEGRDVAAFDVFGVILGVISADAAPDVIVPCHALAQIHHDRPRRIRRANTLVFGDDRGRRNWRPVALAGAQFLRVVRLVAMHPADDGGIVEVLQRNRVLLANDLHSGLFQSGQLFFGRPFPEADVSVEPGVQILPRLGGRLQPDGNGEKAFVVRRPVLPAGVRACRKRLARR